MIVPASNLRRKNPSAGSVILRSIMFSVVVIGVAWCVYVATQISEVAGQDEAQQADAIAVFGAAEYAGRPSPTLHFRLDHAVDLYRRQIAPIVITLGGGGDKDLGNTEGAVGRDYLLAHGIPLASIIAETNSFDTDQQVLRLASIARDNNIKHVVVVSDGTHLFRIRELCKARGLDVYTSPRATVGHISWYDLTQRYLHEILSYTAFVLHIDDLWPGRWFGVQDD